MISTQFNTMTTDLIDRVITSGASLASLLHSVATAPADFDGLLLGRHA